MEFKLLVKNTSYLASTKFVQFFAGILRSKLNAIFIGAEGVGIISQFLMMTKSSSRFTNLGMSEAVVKQIAENSDEIDSIELIASSLKSYLIVISFFILISISLLLFFKTDFTIYLFGSTDYLYIFYLVILTLPFLILNSVFFSILKGFRAVKDISKARVGFIVSNLILFVPLIVSLKLKGAIIYIPLSFVVTMLWNFHYANKKYLKPNGLSLGFILKAKRKPSFQKELLTFSGYGLISSLIAIASIFIARSIVVSNLGISALGIYRPIMAWAGLFTGFLLPSFSTYLYPRFCAVKSEFEVHGIMNDALRLASLSLLPLLLFGIPFRFFFIELLYSKEFLEAADYLPFHFMGTVFYVWHYIFSQSMTPRGYIKQNTIFFVLSNGLNIISAYYLVPKYGLTGWMIRSILASVFLFLIYYFFLRIKVDFKISTTNVILMVYVISSALVIILVEKVFETHLYGMFIGPLIFISTYFLLTNKERNFALKRIKKIFGNK